MTFYLPIRHATQLYQLQLHFYSFGFIIINCQFPECTVTRVKSHTTWEGFDRLTLGGGLPSVSRGDAPASVATFRVI